MTRAMLLASIGDTSEVRESMTLDEFFWGLFLPDAKNKIRATTLQGYITHYVNEVQGVFGGMLMCNIRFEAFKMLRILLNKAVRWDLLDSSPCDQVEPPRKKKKRPKTLSARHAIFYLSFFRVAPKSLTQQKGRGRKTAPDLVFYWRPQQDSSLRTLDY